MNNVRGTLRKMDRKLALSVFEKLHVLVFMKAQNDIIFQSIVMRFDNVVHATIATQSQGYMYILIIVSYFVELEVFINGEVWFEVYKCQVKNTCIH